MGIRVEHGPSMLPVGKLAYRTGQNEYINKRRKELEAQQEQRANRQLKAQMQVNDINAGFQQIQMQHQMGMQRAAAQNEFQLDRDEKNHNWQVNAAGDLFNRQKELSDINHGYGLDRAEFANNLQDQTMIRNNQSLQMDKTLNTMYSQSNEQGRELIDNWRGQMAKLYSHVGEGKIDEQQYRASYNEGLSNIMSQLTGDQSSVYRIGSEFLPGGTSVMYGGAIKRTIGQNGESIYERNYEVDPATGQPINEDAWDEKYGNVRFAGPDDKVGYYYEYDMQTGERRRVSNLPEWQAIQRAQLDAAKMMADRQTAAEPLTKSDALARYKEEGELYDTLNPEPLREDAAGNQNPEWTQWQADRQKAIESNLSDEERIAFGLAPQLGGDDLLPTGGGQQAQPAQQPLNEDPNRPHASSQWTEPPHELQLGNEEFSEFQNIQAPTGLPPLTPLPGAPLPEPQQQPQQGQQQPQQQPQQGQQQAQQQAPRDLRRHFYSRLASRDRTDVGKRADELNTLLQAKGMNPISVKDLAGMSRDNYKSFLDSVFDADEGPEVQEYQDVLTEMRGMGSSSGEFGGRSNRKGLGQLVPRINKMLKELDPEHALEHTTKGLSVLTSDDFRRVVTTLEMALEDNGYTPVQGTLSQRLRSSDERYKRRNIAELIPELNALLGEGTINASSLAQFDWDDFDAFVRSVEEAEKEQGPRPAGNEGAAFDNKLNFLDSMS